MADIEKKPGYVGINVIGLNHPLYLPDSMDRDSMAKAIQSNPEVMALKGNQTALNKKQSIGKTIAQKIAPYSGDVLRYGGMMAGGAIGGVGGTLAEPGGGTVLGTLGGESLGYGIGNELQNKLEQYAGTAPKGTLGQQLKSAGKGVVEGGLQSILGGIAEKAIMRPAAKLVGKAYEKIAPAISEKLQSNAENLMGRVLKIPPSVKDEIRDDAIKTSLSGKYPVSKQGLNKLRTNIDSINNKISGIISENPYKPIKTKDFIQKLDLLRNDVKKLPNPSQQLLEIDNIIEGIKKYRGDQIHGALAQDMKKALYKSIATYYRTTAPIGGHVPPSLSIQADKNIAWGLKDELVKAYPQLAALNKEDSSLISLGKYLERAVNRTRNVTPIKLSDIMTALVTGEAYGKFAAFSSTVAKKVLEAPGTQSRIAIALSEASKSSGKKIAPEFIKYAVNKAMMKKIVGNFTNRMVQDTNNINDIHNINTKPQPSWKEIGGDQNE